MVQKRKKIYISGAISGRPLEQAKAEFAWAKQYLEGFGFVAVNPFDNGLPDEAPWIEHLLVDLRMLHECDALYALKSWMVSRGAEVEMSLARALDKPCFLQEDEDFQDTEHDRDDLLDFRDDLYNSLW